MRNSLEQHPTNGKTLDWFEKLHTKGKLSEERLKYEAQVFLAVQNSSIGDLVTHSLTHSEHLLILKH